MECSFATTSIAWRCKWLLESLCEVFQLFVPIIQLFLYLLELGLEPSILIFRNIIRDFQISIMILQVLFLHFGKVVEWLGLRLLLDTKNHLSKLLSLVVVEMTWGSLDSTSTHHRVIAYVSAHAWHVSSSVWDILVQDPSHHVASHKTLWLDVSHWLLRKPWLLPHLLLVLHSVEILLHLLLLLFLEHVVLLLELLLVFSILQSHLILTHLFVQTLG